MSEFPIQQYFCGQTVQINGEQSIVQSLSSFYSIPSNQTFRNSLSIEVKQSDKSSPTSVSQHFETIPNFGDCVKDRNQEIKINEFSLVCQCPQQMPQDHPQKPLSSNMIQTGKQLYNCGHLGCSQKNDSLEIVLLQPWKVSQQIAFNQSDENQESYLQEQRLNSCQYQDSDLQSSQSQQQSESEYEVHSQFNSDSESEQLSLKKPKPNNSRKKLSTNLSQSQLNPKNHHSKPLQKKVKQYKRTLNKQPQQLKTDGQSLVLSQETVGKGQKGMKRGKRKEIRKRKEKQRRKPTSQHYSMFNYIENYFN